MPPQIMEQPERNRVSNRFFSNKLVWPGQRELRSCCTCDLSRLDAQEFDYLQAAPDGTATRGGAMFQAMVTALVEHLGN